jgi:TatD DNase family protein
MAAPCYAFCMQLTDTHCHIQEVFQPNDAGAATNKLWAKAVDPDPDRIIERAVEAGVTRLICVGTTLEDSKLAVEFVQNRPNCWASIGIHPHEAKDFAENAEAWNDFAELAKQPKVVAVGECGLDYFYGHSPKEQQAVILRRQIETAVQNNLPLIFHVRDAFDDFWPIFDSYKGLRGVVHSFSANQDDLKQILKRDLYVGLNGIMTFTKNQEQLAAAKAVPLEGLLLETDAPFLTPAPYRGTVCEPKHVRVTAEFLAQLRDEPIETIAQASTQNAIKLFNL